MRALEWASEGPVDVIAHRPGHALRVFIDRGEADFVDGDLFIGMWRLAPDDDDSVRLFGAFPELPGGPTSRALVAVSTAESRANDAIGPEWEVIAPRERSLSLIARNYTGGGISGRTMVHQTTHAWTSALLAPQDTSEAEMSLSFEQSLASTTTNGSFSVPAGAPFDDEGVAFVAVSSAESFGALPLGALVESAIVDGVATFEVEHVAPPADERLVTLLVLFAPGAWQTQVAFEGAPPSAPQTPAFLPIPMLDGGAAGTTPLVWGEPWDHGTPHAGVPLFLFVSPVTGAGLSPRIRVDVPADVEEIVLPELPIEAVTDPSLALTTTLLAAMPMWCEEDDGLYDGTSTWCRRNARGPVAYVAWPDL